MGESRLSSIETEIRRAAQELLPREEDAPRPSAEFRREPMPDASSANGRAHPEDRAFPLSFAQQRLWFLDQLEPASPLYNLPVVIRLYGTLDTGALERALNDVVARHDALRTRFISVDGNAAQIARSPGPIGLQVLDLTARPTEERETAA